jgi:phage/plasmid primase-like uncharacterized protein
MTTPIEQQLAAREIYVTGPGKHRTVCPRCDKGTGDTALSVNVNGSSAVWHCFRCEWKGGTGDRVNGYAYRRDPIEESAQHERVATQALHALRAASYISTGSHAYLKKKRIDGVKIKADCNSRLLVPIFDVEGKLWNLQTIDTTGEKRFLPGGRVKGCFSWIGDNWPVSDRIVICEGWATGASIFEADNTAAVIVALNAGNLEPVARAVRAVKSDAGIVIAADDDWRTAGNPGLSKARAAAALIGAGVAVPEFPESRPESATDFNDMVATAGREAVRKIIMDALGSTPEPRQPPPESERRELRTPRVLNLADYRATRFKGEPPPPKWLIDGSIPLGVPVLLAAMGGVGKSFLTLQLGVTVATPPEPIAANVIDLNHLRPILGGPVAAHGPVVIVTAEDDDATIHRRLKAVDPHERRTDDLTIVALPNAGGPLPLFVMDRDGVRATDEWLMLSAQLRAVENLKLVVIDPLQAFVQAPLDSDSAAAQFVMSAFGQLATETGATVLVCHHMRKSTNGKATQTPAEARDAIRGASALVDGSRAVYALWPAGDSAVETTAKLLQTPLAPGDVVKGAIVKSNGAKPGGDATYVRAESGLLVDRTAQIRSVNPSNVELWDWLEADIAACADDRMPLQKTGYSGVFEQQECLYPALRNLSRDRLRKLCQELIDAGRVVKCRARGSCAAVWLDVPGGRFALADGQGEIRTGARTQRHQDAAA